MAVARFEKFMKKIYYGWYVVAACFCLCFLYAGGGFYSFSVFIKPIENDFGWNRADIALTMSIYLIIGGLMGPVVGKLIQRFGTRTIMNIGAAGTGACFLLIGKTQSLWYFYTIYALMAVSVSGMGIIPISSILSNWFDQRRGTAIGAAMVGISAGGLLLVPFVRYFTALYGWKAAFMVIGILVWSVALPLINLVIKERPEKGIRASASPDKRPADKKSSLKDNMFTEGWPADKALKSGSFWCVFTAFFLTPFAQMGVLQHQVPLMMETGATEAMAALALGLTAGVGGVGKLSFGRISEVRPFRDAVLLCFGLQALSVIVLLLVRTPFVVWVYALMFGFSMGGVVVLMPLAVSHFWGLLSYSMLLGVLWIANCLGGALGTYTSGLIYDYLGNYRYALYLYVAAYLSAMIAFLAAGKAKAYKGIAPVQR